MSLWLDEEADDVTDLHREAVAARHDTPDDGRVGKIDPSNIGKQVSVARDYYVCCN